MEIIEKFSLDEYIEEEVQLLEYVEMLACSCHPDYDWDDEVGGMAPCGTASTALFCFCNRYNIKSLIAYYSYEDYISNKDIQDTLQALNIDINKFWYLLLFISDYTASCCLRGEKVQDTPKEAIQKLVNQIENNLEYNTRRARFSFINKMQLSLKTESEKHSIIIEDPTALAFICQLWNDVKDGLEHSGIMNITHIDKEAPETECDTVHILMFYRLLKEFLFDILPNISTGSNKIQAYTTVSTNKTLLISRLVYFTKLSKDERYTGYDKKKDKLCPNFLKDQLKSYKDYKISRTNTFYI